MVEMLGMVLDFMDALAGAVAIAFWWCTWVQPPKRVADPPNDAGVSAPADIDGFLLKVRACPDPRALPQRLPDRCSHRELLE